MIHLRMSAFLKHKFDYTFLLNKTAYSVFMVSLYEFKYKFLSKNYIKILVYA